MLEADSINLSFSGRAVLSGCYIHCKPGEIVGLLGRNGSGKSSLLKIIFGSLKADFRHIRIDNQIIGRGFKTQRISYLPQEPFLLHSLLTNTIINDFQSSSDIIIPDTVIADLKDKKAGELSGGQQRIIELLWLLSLKTDYILLDEPFSGISPIFIEILQEIIKQAGAKKGIILTDHLYRPLLEISDRIVLLHNNAVYNIRQETDLVRYQYVPDGVF